MVIRFVGPARPEETLQPIAFAPGHNMHVQVRHALAYAIVYCYERAFGLHCGLYGVFEMLSGFEQRTYKIRRKIGQRRMVLNWNQQHVSRKERSVIQKRERAFVAPYDLGRHVSRRDLAERTIHFFKAEFRCSR